MSFTNTSLLSAINQSNKDLIGILATKYGFDANEAMDILGSAPVIASKSTKSKKVKDPNAPKRAPTAFFLFSKQFRTENAEGIKGQRASEVAKLAGAEWSLIKETEAAQPFNTEAAELKLVAAAAMEAYSAGRMERSAAPSPESVFDASTDDDAGVISPVSASPEPKVQKVKKVKKVKVEKPKKEKKVQVEKPAKPVVPSVTLPFLGTTSGCCEGIRNNHGLYTQCQKAPVDEKFCKTCATQAGKNAHGMPNCGTIEGRDALTWRAPSGQQPVTYATFLQKEGNHAHVLADHSVADTEAAKFGWTIPAAQWEQTPRRQGRPKAAKTAVVTDSDGSDAEPVNAVDLVAKLVAEAKSANPDLQPVAPVAPVAKCQTVEQEDLTPDAFEDETPLKVTPFTFEGVEYLIDKSSNDLYCTHTHEMIGVLKHIPKPHIQFDEGARRGCKERASGKGGGMRTHRQSRRGKKSRSKRRKSRMTKGKRLRRTYGRGKAKRPTRRDLSTCRAVGTGAIELLIDCQREKKGLAALVRNTNKACMTRRGR